MSDFNMPPGVSARDIPGHDDQRDDGGPAFPCQEYGALGMTLRDYFAVAALPAMLQRPGVTLLEAPIRAYIVADAMLKARAQ